MFFINNRCKAQFYNNSQVTFYVRKECVDIIFKIRKGVYLTVSVHSLSDDRLLLACDWGNFWNRLKYIPNYKHVIAKLEKACPLTVDLFLKTSGIHFAYIDKEQQVGAIVIEMRAPIISGNVSDYLHKEVIEKAMVLMKFNLNLLVEMEENCPFQQWKIDLEGLRK